MSWRDYLRPASFRGARFYIEAGGKRSGRRSVTHEFPKRDDPYTEDMGRRARRWTITAYVLGDDYLLARDALIGACERSGAGLLIHPTIGEEQVVCEHYHCVEQRERGGLAEFEMQFAEAGVAPSLRMPYSATSSTSSASADTAAGASIDALDTSLWGGS
jgi:prophage DNA circulation protein